MTDEERVAAVVKVLTDNGGAPGNSLHSWRCEYPERYGKCDCLEQTAAEIIAALDGQTSTSTSACDVCAQQVEWIDCPTGGWWAHLSHPSTTVHDAVVTR